jgi:hypothetical protein
MTAAAEPFAQWLEQAGIQAHRLSPDQLGLLRGAFAFQQQQGTDYYSTRILSHFLLNVGSGLKVAQLARLLGISRPTASRQQNLSSKAAIQQAHHRLDGRPYGKLLPRFAGPIAGFLFENPNASRADLLDFIDATFSVRVSRVALTKFLNKFGLDEGTRRQGALSTTAASPTTTIPPASTAATAPPAPVVVAPATPPPGPALARPAGPDLTPRLAPAIPFVAQGQPLPSPTPPFSGRAPSTPAPSC